MSSLPLFSAAAPSRSIVVASPAWSTQVFQHLSAIPKLAGVTSASRLEVRPALQMVSSGVQAIDSLTGGLPRGCLTEVCGPASSGRTSILLAALAAATQRQEVCALVDVSDALNPHLGRGCRCRFRQTAVDTLRENNIHHRDTEAQRRMRKLEKPVEQALRVTDLLLQSVGFGLVIIDLGDTSLKMARRIPLATWFRFQRAVERTSTVLFVISQVPCAQTCASLLLKVSGRKLSAVSYQLSAKDSSEKTYPTHAQLLDGLQVQGEILRSRLDRKPSRSVTDAIKTKVRAG